MGNCLSDTKGGQQSVHVMSNKHSPDSAIEANAALHSFLASRGALPLLSHLEMSLSATDLRNRDALSKSDPMAVVYFKREDGSLEEVGRTEVILNCLHPVWVLKPQIVYHFEFLQPLLFKVYDVDTKFHNIPVQSIKLEEQDHLGEAECYLSEIVRKEGQIKLPLRKGSHHPKGNEGAVPSIKKYGELNIQISETLVSKTVVELTLHCTDLQNKDLFSKSDPFLMIFKQGEGGSVPIYKTNVIKNNLNPEWKVSLSMQQVGNQEDSLRIECYNFNNSGNHETLGMVDKSLADLEKLYTHKAATNLYLHKGNASNEKILKSQLHVEYYSTSTKYSFLDYISNGYELNFMVAVDFTASNGNPRLPDSLHYLDPSGRTYNAYQRAICAVGEVLEYYDSDRHFPAWGFGGRPIDGPVSHCFNLNGSNNHAEVEGIKGVLSAYANALYNVTLAGPTLFGHVITQAAQIARKHADQPKYFVLLIITDGVITDIQETKDAIVKASDLPLSILIVGVGGADFKEMEILDADKGELLQSCSGQVAIRDIVQFVPLRNLPTVVSVAQSLLTELPGQFLNYVRNRKVEPFANQMH